MNVGVIVLNKRKLRRKIVGVLFVVLAFVMLLLSLNSKVDMSVFKVNSDFLTYKDKSGMFSFEYPKGYTITKKELNSQDVIKHVEFQDAVSGVHGFVQVWNLKEPLKEFLEGSQKYAVGNLNFKYNKLSPIKVNGIDGYQINSSRMGNDDKYYKTKDTFFKVGNFMYRLSFSQEEDLWNNKVDKIQQYMLKNFKFQ
jgi:hypothetical protein